MKFYHVAIKGLKEIFRDRKGLALLLAFPAIFMFVFGFAFSGGESGNNPYRVAVINNDRGAQLSSPNGDPSQRNFGDELIEAMEELEFEDSKVSLFKVERVEPERAEELLKDRDVACLLTIPGNFSGSIKELIKDAVRREVTGRVGEMVITGSGGTPPPEIGEGMTENLPSDRSLPEAESVTSTIEIKGDPGYSAFGRVRGILVGIISQFKEEVLRRARERTSTYFEAESTRRRQFVTTETVSISGSESMSTFDYQAPGIFVFALLMSAIGVAGTLAGEVDDGTLERLKLSRMSSFDLLLGTLIPWSVLTVVQVLILFAVALLIGFNWVGGVFSLLWAILVAVIAGVASVALGLLVAGFAENEQHATNLGTLIAVPVSFIVGAFFPIPELSLGQVLGFNFKLYDILPWTHAAESLRILLAYGGGIDEIAVHLLLLVALTVLLFFVGVLFFSRNRMTSVE